MLHPSGEAAKGSGVGRCRSMPQVQHLALGSFLGRDWSSVDYLATVPPAFLAEALVPAACGWTSAKGGSLRPLPAAFCQEARHHNSIANILAFECDFHRLQPRPILACLQRPHAGSMVVRTAVQSVHLSGCAHEPMVTSFAYAVVVLDRRLELRRIFICGGRKNGRNPGYRAEGVPHPTRPVCSSREVRPHYFFGDLLVLSYINAGVSTTSAIIDCKGSVMDEMWLYDALGRMARRCGRTIQAAHTVCRPSAAASDVRTPPPAPAEGCRVTGVAGVWRWWQRCCSHL